MLLFVNDLVIFVGDDLRLQSPQVAEDLGQSVPLAGDFVAGIAVTPRIVVA
jgi:hypothetical protein